MKALTLSLALFTVLISSGANATLVASDGGKTVYDTDLNIYWLANANLAATNTFGVSGISTNGLMTLSTAKIWIVAMNTANYLGYNDWRLPTITNTGSLGCSQSGFSGGDCGYNVNTATGEMAHLYYDELDNKAFVNAIGSFQPGYGLVDNPANPNDESLFTSLQPYFYWYGKEYGLSGAWYFNFAYGLQSPTNNADSLYALAVRDGQVAAVPVPAAAWLLGTGLLCLIGAARRKAA